MKKLLCYTLIITTVMGLIFTSYGCILRTCYVGVQPAPTVTLTAGSTNIDKGDSVTLIWNSSNANSVKSSNFGATSVSGQTTVTPDTTTAYSITVGGPGGEASASVTVVVGEMTPEVSLTASASSIVKGDTVNLTWTSSNANSVKSSNFGATSVSGQASVTPGVTTTYSITVVGPGGEAQASVTVSVYEPVDETDIIY